MQHAHLWQLLKRILWDLLIELCIQRFLFYLAGPTLNLVDTFPKLFLLHLQRVKFLLQLKWLLLQLIQLIGQFFLLHLQQPNLLFFLLYCALALALRWLPYHLPLLKRRLKLLIINEPLLKSACLLDLFLDLGLQTFCAIWYLFIYSNDCQLVWFVEHYFLDWLACTKAMAFAAFY